MQYSHKTRATSPGPGPIVHSSIYYPNGTLLQKYFKIKIRSWVPSPQDATTYAPMNEARLSHLPFWGPREGFFLIDSTAVGLTRIKKIEFGLRVRVNPWVKLGERFIRVDPTDV